MTTAWPIGAAADGRAGSSVVERVGFRRVADEAASSADNSVRPATTTGVVVLLFHRNVAIFMSFGSISRAIVSIRSKIGNIREKTLQSNNTTTSNKEKFSEQRTCETRARCLSD